MSDPANTEALGTEEASRFQCDLYRYWRAAHQLGALRVGARRAMTRAAMRQLRAQLDPAWDAAARADDLVELADLRLYFIRRLLERLGLLRRDAERGLVPGPQSEVARFFALPLEERLRLLVKLWIGGGWWVERPDERVEPPGLRAPAHPAVAVSRRQALQALLDAPADAAISVDQLPSMHDQATARRDKVAHAGARSRRRAPPPPHASSVATALLGPLCWLGLAVPVGRQASQADAPVVRPTRALEALRTDVRPLAAGPLVEFAGPVLVGADFDVLAYPPLTAGTLMTLDACCEPVGSGVVARYRLTRTGLVQARRQGWSAGEVARRLTALTGEVPQNIARTLQDWERQADRIHVRSDVAVLRVRVPRLLDQLAADTACGRALVRRLTPTVALIAEAEVPAVRRWLLRHGEFPAMAPPAEQ